MILRNHEGLIDYANHQGETYRFPRDVERYQNDTTTHAANCERGHFDCAAWDGGPCSDELTAWEDKDAERDSETKELDL